MKKILEFDNVNIEGIIKDLNLTMSKGKFKAVLGGSASGKTLITKAIAGLMPFSGVISIDEEELTTKSSKELYKKIAILFENPDSLFFSDNVFDEIYHPIKNRGVSKKEAKEEVEHISSVFGITNILNRNLSSLSGSEKQMIAIASAVAKNPEVIIIDDALSRLSTDEKFEVLNYIKKHKIAVLYLTNDGSIALFADEVAILQDGSIKTSGTKEEILVNDKELATAGINPPFMTDLSNKLKYYELVDDLIYDMKDMVNKIWK